MKWFMGLSFAPALLHPLLFVAWWAVLLIWANGQKKAPHRMAVLRDAGEHGFAHPYDNPQSGRNQGG